MQEANNFSLSFPKLKLGLTFFLLFGLLGCGKVTQSAINAIGVNVTPIAELRPQQDSATVYLQGKVANVVPLLQQQRVYQLKDSSGTIWVVTNKANLQVEDQVVIQGKLRYRSIPLAGKEFGEVYLEEEQQLERQPGK